jgi:hypothetical protein
MFIGLFCSTMTQTQPSGRPYGSVLQSYVLPKAAGTIYYVAPDGKPNTKGDKLASPTTIDEGIKCAKT